MRALTKLMLIGGLAGLSAACDGSTGFTATSVGGPGGEGTINGVVTADGAGLGGVSVVATGAQLDTAITNGSGAYLLDGVSSGQYTVSVLVPIGYRMAAGQTGSRTVTVPNSGTAIADFVLESVTTSP